MSYSCPLTALLKFEMDNQCNVVCYTFGVCWSDIFNYTRKGKRQLANGNSQCWHNNACLFLLHDPPPTAVNMFYISLHLYNTGWKWSKIKEKNVKVNKINVFLRYIVGLCLWRFSVIRVMVVVLVFLLKATGHPMSHFSYMADFILALNIITNNSIRSVL